MTHPTTEYLLNRVEVFDDAKELAEELVRLADGQDHFLVYYLKESAVSLVGMDELILQMAAALRRQQKTIAALQQGKVTP